MTWIKIFTRELSLFHVYAANEGYTKDMQKEVGWHFRNSLFVSRNGVETSYYPLNDQNQFINYIKRKIASEREVREKYILKINNQLRNYTKDALKTYNKLKPFLRTKKPEKERLRNAIGDVYYTYRRLYSIYRFPTLLDLNSESLGLSQKTIKDCVLTKDFTGRAFDKYETKLLPKLFELLGKYFKIKKIYAESLLFQEIEKSLVKSQLVVDKETLKSRYRFYVLLTKNDITRLYLGKKAASIEKKELKEEFKISEKEIYGQTAMKGLIKGKVTVVMARKDLSKIKNKDILVTPMTRVDYAPYLKKVSAIVTDEGGITCHAAIISRELNIPCIIGTKIATKVLKDGDLVEVDAKKGIVKVIKKKYPKLWTSKKRKY